MRGLLSVLGSGASPAGRGGLWIQHRSPQPLQPEKATGATFSKWAAHQHGAARRTIVSRDELTNGSIQCVPFHSYELLTLQIDQKPYVVMKPIVDAIGVGWKGQHEKLKAHPVLSKGVRKIRIPSAGGEQSMTCLALELFPAWLARLNANKVTPSVRGAVILFQEESYAALASYWGEGVAINPRAAEPEITPYHELRGFSLGETRPVIEDAVAIGAALGFEGNNRSLFALRVARRTPNGKFIEQTVNTLGLLEAPAPLALLTPTNIGDMIGMSNQAVNKRLEAMGLQAKVAGQWEPTDEALKRNLCRMVEVNKAHSDSGFTTQLKWYSSIVPVLQQEAA